MGEERIRNLLRTWVLVLHDSFGPLLQYFTGSKQHNIALRERWHKQGLKLSEYGITVVATDKLEKLATEEAFYRRLGMQYIPPELREAQGEIEKAEQGAIPKLVELSDIKGDLHTHTEWSDGHDSIEELARAAQDMGISISQSRSIPLDVASLTVWMRRG